MNRLYFLFFFLCIGVFFQAEGRRCNEVFCASVVSKCILTQACKCDISRDKEKCTCCVDCAKCLGRYYQRCCSCLEMCDAELMALDPNESQVGEFSDPFDELFIAVTQEKEPLLDGTVITYPVEVALEQIPKKHHKHKYKKDPYTNEAMMPLPRMGINCTVAFMSQCHSLVKCRSQCKTIGAGSFRFFFNGCCQCVGETCLNYGINESRCSLCSTFEDEDAAAYYDHDSSYASDDPSPSAASSQLDDDFIL